jgi:hypothetical protein
MAATRARLGGRRILLYDNYPANDDHGQALGLILGPLRNRGADLAEEIDIYLACPMTQLGASRLPLLTTADYLKNPRTYDPDRSWRAALRRLSGEDRDTRSALTVQASEWSAWIGEPGHQSYDIAGGVVGALETLEHPTARAEWMDVEILYPSRIADLMRIPDERFREDLLGAMRRRLAAARTLPLLREARARRQAGLSLDTDMCVRLAKERRQLEPDPGALRVFDELMNEAEEFGASVQCVGDGR